MTRDNDTYTVKDLVALIDRTAMDCMTDPVLAYRKHDGTFYNLTELSNHNSMTAMRNAGIREMANRLKDYLARDEDGDANG